MDIYNELGEFTPQALLDSLSIGIVKCNFDAAFTLEEVNQGFLLLTGYTEPELKEQFCGSLVELIHPDDCRRVSENISRQFLNREPIHVKFRIGCRDGNYKEVWYSGHFNHIDEKTDQLFGVVAGVSGTGSHGNEQGKCSETISPFWGKQNGGLGSSSIMVWEWDMGSDTMSYSHTWNSKCGGEPEYNRTCPQEALRGRVYQEDLPAYSGFIKELQQGCVYATAEFRLFDFREKYVWCQIHALNLFDQYERPVKAVGVVFDVDEEKKAMDELKIRAERDALTGLYNRNETEKQMKAYLDTRPEALCALFMIDTDDFKQINDTKGHMLGDIVLTEMAFGMKKIMRESDVVGRIGGDEFTIFMKNISSREDAVRKAEDLSKMFRHLFENEKRSVKITCSIGVALYPDDGTDFQTLYRHADQALYQAKSQGKDGYMVYDKGRTGLTWETGYSSLGTVIESQVTPLGGACDLVSYIFKPLYTAEDLDQAVNMSLELVGKWFDVSRAYIFETGNGGEYYTNTYEWCNEGIEPEIGNLQHVDTQTAGNYMELFGEDSIYYCRNTHSLPPAQRNLFEAQGIRSFLQYALWEKKTFAGFIGFDECTGMRLWTKEEVGTLSQVSELLDIFLKKKKMKEQLKAAQHLLQEIIERQDEYLFVIRKDTCEVLFANSRIKGLIPKLEPGTRCHQVLFYQDTPCKFCPLQEGMITSRQNNICAAAKPFAVKWENEDAYIIPFRHVDEKNTLNDVENITAGGKHIAAERSIVDCIKWLTTSEYLEDSIEYVLGIILNYYQSDRVYILEADEEKGTGSNTYEVCADGVAPQIENLQNVPIEAISFWMKQFTIRDYIKIDDVEELGPDRQMEYDVLKEQGIKSLMALPLYVKGEMKGFLGLDDPKSNRHNFHYLEELRYFIENEITKNSMRRRLERMSYEDNLTGLENRNSYMAYSDDFSKRFPVPAGVIFMDINGLKKLNGARGHIYGDMVITYIADTIKQFFPNGRKFRLSGDEFLVVTESVPYEEFQKNLNQMENKLTDNGVSLVSVGSTWSDVGTELSELMGKADRLMQIRKQDYYKGYQEISAKKMPLLRGVVDSIANRQYLIYLQPKFNMESQKVDRAEVLVRYREKDGSISSPFKFIPLLESEGLISNIDFFVMEEVCRLLTRWKNTDFANMQLSLNFSRITLFDKHFFDEFWRIFKKYDLKPEQLEIEITESQETLNKKQMAFQIEELKKYGFKIALDDFGVEYSSYEFLMMADFDVLKIDKGIIQKYGDTARGARLVRHIVDMGHSIGTKCCAEGVETREQFEFMKEIGCDYVQGYLVDRPMPVEQFMRKYLLSANHCSFL